MTRPRPFEIQRAFHIVAQPDEMGSGGWSRKTSARNATHFRSQGVCLAGGWHMRGFVTQQAISVIMPSHLRTPGDTITWRRAFPSALTCTHDASYVGRARRQGGLAASSLAASLASPGSQIGIALQTPYAASHTHQIPAPRTLSHNGGFPSKRGGQFAGRKQKSKDIGVKSQRAWLLTLRT